MVVTSMRSPETEKELIHVSLRKTAPSSQLHQLASNSSPQLTEPSQDSQKVESNASSRNLFTHLFLGLLHARSFRLETYATLMKFQMKATSLPVATSQWSETNACHPILRLSNVWNSVQIIFVSRNMHLN